MSEFKVGDKVRVLSNDCGAYKEVDVLFEVLGYTTLVRIGNYDANATTISSLELVK